MEKGMFKYGEMGDFTIEQFAYAGIWDQAKSKLRYGIASKSSEVFGSASFSSGVALGYDRFKSIWSD